MNENEKNRQNQALQRFHIKDAITKEFVDGFRNLTFDIDTCDDALASAKKLNPNSALFVVGSVTIDTIFQQYLDAKKSIWSAKTLKTNVSNYNNHIYPYIGQEKIDTINYIDYQKLANKLLCDRVLSPKTVKNIFVILTGLVHFAQRMDLYFGIDYVQYVEFPDFDNKQYFTLSVEMQKRYINAILKFDEPIYKDIFIFLLHGRRLNEVLDLKWEFLDLNEKIMYLPSLRNKSKKNLSFEMTDLQMNALYEHHEKAKSLQGSAFLKGHVFLNPTTGKRFSDVRKPWTRLLENNDLPKIRLHDIRHLLGTYLINELYTPIEHVSHLLGHSSIEVTQRYVNQKPANAKACMESLFNSLKTKGEEYFEDEESHNEISAHAQALLFEDKNSQVVKRE